MDTIFRDKTLLALLLALRNLEDPLSQFQQAQLHEVGEQLKLDPDDWEFIEEGLLAVVTSNTLLNKEFETAKAKLDSVDNIQELLPTDNDIDEKIFLKIERRGNNTEQEENRPPIVKITCKFLKDDDLAKIIKKSSWIERVLNSLNY